jgi:heme exporter protein D
MKFLRNPNLTIAVLAVYTACVYLYFFPRNNEMGTAYKWATVGASVVVLALLWLLLRRKEQLRKKREEEMKKDRNSE